MDTIIGALKDLGEKKWLINFWLPSAIFVGIFTIHLALIKIGFANLFLWWTGLSLDIKLFAVIVFLLVSFLVATLFDFATDSILRLVAGFEGQFFVVRWIHRIGHSIYLKHFHKQNQKYQTLATKENISYEEQQEIAQLEDDLHNFPVQQERIRSTKIGNILSSVVEYTELRFGLDLRASWARMVYSACPDTFREVLLESRIHLDLVLRLGIFIFVYTLFFVIYYLSLKNYTWCFLILGVGFLALLTVSKSSESSAKDYAELIKSMYDLYRFDLYKSLRMPLPKKSGDTEIAAGRQLSEHLWRGTNDLKYFESKKSE